MLKRLHSEAYPSVDQNSAVVNPKVFYGRLTPSEQIAVRATVKDISAFLDQNHLKKYMVAGVGGILRRKDPSEAQDIDLAVSGLKYAPIDGHGFHHVEEFTGTLYNFFESLRRKMTDAHSPRRSDGRSKPIGLGGSGPFVGLDQFVEGDSGETRVRLETNFENFGQYNSKGLQVQYQSKGVRPIDMQFAFNRTIDEWVMDQTVPERSYHLWAKAGLSNELHFSPLLMKT